MENIAIRSILHVRRNFVMEVSIFFCLFCLNQSHYPMIDFVPHTIESIIDHKIIDLPGM